MHYSIQKRIKILLMFLLCYSGISAENNNRLATDIYLGYSVGTNYQPYQISHGMNIGVLFAYNYLMTGADFKVSLSEPEIGNHSWGGYAVLGIRTKHVGIGALIGGCGIYTTRYLSHTYTDYIGGYAYTCYNPEATYWHYTSRASFDGGILFAFDPFSDKLMTATLIISSTYYTPISISIGFTMHN